jgi:hypothetical protein
MSIQTSVSIAPAIGVPGQEYDGAFNDVVTKIAAEDIPFGAFVGFTAEGTCEIPDSAGEVTGGGAVALLDPNKASGEGYKAGDPVRCLVRGRCFVLNEETVALGDAVFVRHTNATKGAFRNDTDSSTAATPPNMKWFQGGAVGLAVIQVG